MKGNKEIGRTSLICNDIPSLLALDSIAPGVFRNRHNKSNTYASIFGGQFVAQALAAADATVPARYTAHSLHGYFLRPGTVDHPIDYQVELVRDGARITNRCVTARQNGIELFTMSCSYRVAMQSFEHQMPLERTFDPENAIDLRELASTDRSDLSALIKAFSDSQPIEVRLPEKDAFTKIGGEPHRYYWLRVPDSSNIDAAASHRQILGYISDYIFAGVPLVPHTHPMPGPHVTIASLDHSIWFHRPVRCDDWLLFDTSSPSAKNGTSFSQARVYNRGGSLVASVAQETLQVLN